MDGKNSGLAHACILVEVGNVLELSLQPSHNPIGAALPLVFDTLHAMRLQEACIVRLAVGLRNLDFLL